MTTAEIRDALMTGKITPDQAKAEFQALHKVQYPPPMKMPIPTHQINDRESLAAYNPRLAGQLANLDANHFYQRERVEEAARHAIGLFAYGLIGLVDGLADSAFYGLSELTEDVTFGVTRTIYRFKDGIQRGKQ